MHIHKGDLAKAVACFEQVKQAYPDNYDTLKVLGSLYATLGGEQNEAKAIVCLRRVTEMNPNNYKSLMELSQLLEASDQFASLRGYERYVVPLGQCTSIAPHALSGAHDTTGRRRS